MKKLSGVAAYGPLKSSLVLVRLNHLARFIKNGQPHLRFQQGSDNKTDDTFASANVCSGAQCCLFNSSTRFGLLLSRAVLPVPLPGSLLPISFRRALLSAPRLACRGLWSPWVLSLLVKRFSHYSRRRPHHFLKSPLCSCISITLPASDFREPQSSFHDVQHRICCAS